MRFIIVGGGYVGLVTAGVLCGQGHDVQVVEREPQRLAAIRNGIAPFYEPGLTDLLQQGVREGRLYGVGSLAAAADGDIIMLCVGTPQGDSGAHDLTALHEAVDELKRAWTPSYRTVVIKSTVPVGTGDWLEQELSAMGLRPRHDFDVILLPEFLRQGQAVTDAMHPDRVVIGAREPAQETLDMLRTLFCHAGAPALVVNRATAEMIKCAANAFLAARVSLINELSRLCEATGVDVELVAKGVGLDRRIGPHFLAAGWGFGGSCLPKDTAALVHLGSVCGVKTAMLSATLEVNHAQQMSAVSRLQAVIGPLQGRNVGVWGLSFKAGTGDLRGAPSLLVIPALKAAGVQLCLHDPVAMPEARTQFADVDFAATALEACNGADALLILTDWDEYRHFDWQAVRQRMRQAVIVDGRNMFDPDEMATNGFCYVSIGRRRSGGEQYPCAYAQQESDGGAGW